MNESERIDTYQQLQSAVGKIMDDKSKTDADKRDHFRNWVDESGDNRIVGFFNLISPHQQPSQPGDDPQDGNRSED